METGRAALTSFFPAANICLYGVRLYGHFCRKGVHYAPLLLAFRFFNARFKVLGGVWHTPHRHPARDEGSSPYGMIRPRWSRCVGRMRVRPYRYQVKFAGVRRRLFLRPTHPFDQQFDPHHDEGVGQPRQDDPKPRSTEGAEEDRVLQQGVRDGQMVVQQVATAA